MKKSNMLIVLLVMLSVVFTSCDLSAPGDEGDVVDKAALTLSIDEATTLLGSKTVGIELGNISQTVSDAYDGAITSAKGVKSDADATQSDVNSAVLTLGGATTVFNDAIITADDLLVSVDSSVLKGIIVTATALNTATDVGSVDGNVLQGDKTAFTAAIAAAQGVIDDETSTQSLINTALVTLNTAVKTFQDAVLSFSTVYNFDEDPAPSLYNGDTGAALSIVSDPLDSTNKVLSLVKTSSSAAWALAIVSTGYNYSGPVLESTGASDIFKVRLYSPAIGQNFQFKIENSQNSSEVVTKEVVTTVANEWETLIFDFGTFNASHRYNKLVLIPNLSGDMSGGDETYYIDNVTFSGTLGAPLQELPFAIDVATILIDSKTVGAETGNVPQGAKDTYTTAIATAQTILDNGDSTQTELDSGVTALATATASFESSIIGGSEPATTPAAPSLDAADVISLYTSSSTYTDITVENWNPGWGQGGSLTDTTVDGKTVKLLDLVDYQGISFGADLDITGKTTLHMSIWTLDGGAFDVFAISSNPEALDSTGNLIVGSWTDVEIDCSVTTDITAVIQLKFAGGTGADYYIDNIYFH